jgi:DNA polymerase I-like protein with 3'-5' exonuclease and polymerase domains
LVFDVPLSEVAELEALIGPAMIDAVALDVPLAVDMSSGRDWLEAH